jgi:hypothetical protein
MMMDELDDGRALSHRGRDALHGRVTDVAGGEDAWDAGLEQHRGTFERPAARSSAVGVQVVPGEDESSLVTLYGAVQPLRARFGADHHE